MLDISNLAGGTFNWRDEQKEARGKRGGGCNAWFKGSKEREKIGKISYDRVEGLLVSSQESEGHVGP